MTQNLPDLALYRAIEGNLTYWLKPEATPPTPETFGQTKHRWQVLKHRIASDYHMNIDNLFASLKRQLTY